MAAERTVLGVAPRYPLRLERRLVRVDAVALLAQPRRVGAEEDVVPAEEVAVRRDEVAEQRQADRRVRDEAVPPALVLAVGADDYETEQALLHGDCV
jgi:hypothetical protein